MKKSICIFRLKSGQQGHSISISNVLHFFFQIRADLKHASTRWAFGYGHDNFERWYIITESVSRIIYSKPFQNPIKWTQTFFYSGLTVLHISRSLMNLIRNLIDMKIFRVCLWVSLYMSLNRLVPIFVSFYQFWFVTYHGLERDKNLHFILWLNRKQCL